jgi:hypothetical protein
MLKFSDFFFEQIIKESIMPQGMFIGASPEDYFTLSSAFIDQEENASFKNINLQNIVDINGGVSPIFQLHMNTSNYKNTLFSLGLSELQAGELITMTGGNTAPVVPYVCWKESPLMAVRSIQVQCEGTQIINSCTELGKANVLMKYMTTDWSDSKSLDTSPTRLTFPSNQTGGYTAFNKTTAHTGTAWCCEYQCPAENTAGYLAATAGFLTNAMALKNFSPEVNQRFIDQLVWASQYAIATQANTQNIGMPVNLKLCDVHNFFNTKCGRGVQRGAIWDMIFNMAYYVAATAVASASYNGVFNPFLCNMTQQAGANVGSGETSFSMTLSSSCSNVIGWLSQCCLRVPCIDLSPDDVLSRRLSSANMTIKDSFLDCEFIGATQAGLNATASTGKTVTLDTSALNPEKLIVCIQPAGVSTLTNSLPIYGCLLDTVQIYVDSSPFYPAPLTLLDMLNETNRCKAQLSKEMHLPVSMLKPSDFNKGYFLPCFDLTPIYLQTKNVSQYHNIQFQFTRTDTTSVDFNFFLYRRVYTESNMRNGQTQVVVNGKAM